MPDQIINVPGVGEVRFPETMRDEDIVTAIRSFTQTGQGLTGSELTPEQRQGRIQALENERASLQRPSFLRDVAGQTLSDLRGVPEASLEAGTAFPATIAGGAASVPVAAVEAFRGGDPAAAGRSIIEEFQEKFTFQPRTEAGQRASEAIAAPAEEIERLADLAGEVSGDPDDVLGATAVKTVLLGGPALFRLRGRTRRADAERIRSAGQRTAQATQNAVNRIAAKFREQSKPPTVEELFKSGSAAFQRATKSGVRVRQDSVQGFGQRLSRELQEEGIDPVLHPKSTRALQRILDDADSGDLSFQQIETLRRIAKDAASSIERPDRRFGRRIVDSIDEYIGQLDGAQATGPTKIAQRSITAARDFWARARKGELLEGLVDRAGIRAGQFSGSGFENAIRTEFRGLAMNERRLRGFTKREVEAIRRVAAGGPVANALRMVGKFAPRGVISTAITAGGGATIGGPLGAIVFTSVAEGARFGATKATRRAAERASELARSGGQ